MQDFDLAIVGGGPGGYSCALHAAQLGGRVALIEKDLVGGTCLNRGCIPTKAIIEWAKYIDAAYALGASSAALDLGSAFESAMAHKRRTVETLRSGLVDLLAARGVEVINGEGLIAGPNAVRVKAEAGEESLSTRSIVVATGSKPSRLALSAFGPSVSPGLVMNSDEALELDHLPGAVTVIGGGTIGIEFAFIFSGFGVTTTVVELQPRLLPREDPEVSQGVRYVLEKRGIKVICGGRIRGGSFGSTSAKLDVVTVDGDEFHLTAAMVLVATGRTPVLPPYNGGGRSAVVETETGGFIKVDERMSTGIPGVYAVGDVTGGHMLAHVAFEQGRVCARNALGVEDTRMDYTLVPRCVYGNPEVACVGLTEEQARARGLQVQVGRFPLSRSGRALVSAHPDGFVKVIADADSGEIVGAHLVGPCATEIVSEVAIAMRLEATIDDVASMIHPHPTYAENLKEAAGAIIGQALHM